MDEMPATFSASRVQLAMQADLQGNYDVGLHQAVQAIVTVLAVINPVVCGSIFLTLTPKLAPAQKRWAAVKVTLSILIILVGSALIGLKVLSIFSISLDVFRIVGGMIIAYMGFDMLSGRQTFAQASPTDDDAAVATSFAPLIMFAAGPGTITSVVTLAAAHTPDGLPVTAIAAAVAVAIAGAHHAGVSHGAVWRHRVWSAHTALNVLLIGYCLIRVKVGLLRVGFAVVK